ncbi:MAG: hypothetical protein DHS20C01_11930 [marine bacterium B5-7]|nr:MAG: hypothetical protein DHS20C01_11930 [marine bacterium B5-7]
MSRRIRIFILSLTILPLISLSAFADALNTAIDEVQTRWANITYHVIGDYNRDNAYSQLETVLEKLAAEYPERAEVKIWDGIVLSTHASVAGSFSALRMVKAAREQLEEALEIDDKALDGSAYTSLGSLYYQVPGWPLAFGSDEKAEENLIHALTINPRGIDPNYFFGDYLFRQGRFEEAKKALETALAAPDRPGRALADAGRRQEVRALMDKINKKTGS